MVGVSKTCFMMFIRPKHRLYDLEIIPKHSVTEFPKLGGMCRDIGFKGSPAFPC